MSNKQTESKHFLRARAQKKERQLEAAELRAVQEGRIKDADRRRFKVEKILGGSIYRWRVVSYD